MRKITSKMFALIDGKLKTHGAAQLAIKNNDSRNLLIYAAEACVGIKEEGGNNKGLYVTELQKTVDKSADQEAWCMAAVQTWIAYVEKKLVIVSPIFSSEHCLTVWEKTKKVQRVLKIPAPGAIIIWQHGNSLKGHTGIVTSYGLTSMDTVEGNTSDSSFRDGDGVFTRVRSNKRDGSMKVVGFLRPFS